MNTKTPPFEVVGTSITSILYKLTFTRKRTIILPIAIVAAIASLCLLAWSFFHTEYTSIKTDMVVTPPFEGTYFGMTIE